jgi:hypothetical protein
MARVFRALDKLVWLTLPPSAFFETAAPKSLRRARQRLLAGELNSDWRIAHEANGETRSPLILTRMARINADSNYNHGERRR